MGCNVVELMAEPRKFPVKSELAPQDHRITYTNEEVKQYQPIAKERAPSMFEKDTYVYRTRQMFVPENKGTHDDYGPIIGNYK